MRVPKMVKNGFNSGLPVSPVFEEDKIPKEIKNGHEAQSARYNIRNYAWTFSNLSILI
jgi:hypothetical protein